MRELYVPADPYAWRYNGEQRPQNTGLIITDKQIDFCGVGGYVDRMGYDISLTRAPIEPIKRSNHPHAIKVIKRQGHVFGAVASSLAFIEAMA
jgi:hypothetical protein